MNGLNTAFRTNRLFSFTIFHKTLKMATLHMYLPLYRMNRFYNHQVIQSYSTISSKKKIIAYTVIGTTIWVLAIGLSLNHQRFSSPVVSYLIYHLKHSSIAEAHLGKNIDFISKWPWISGEINYVKGYIDLSFRVAGSQDKATIKFKSIRKGKSSDWVTLEWKMCLDKNHQEIFLLD